MNPFSNSILSHKTKILLMREMFGSIPSDDVIKWRSQFKHGNELTGKIIHFDTLLQ